MAYTDSPDLKHKPMSGEYVHQRLQMTKAAPGYSKLARVVGTWDDHDYGANNSDRTLEDKRRNRALFLDFLDEPLGSQRRLQDDSPIF